MSTKWVSRVLLMLAEPRLDDAASMDVAWMLAGCPLQWQSSLVSAAMGNNGVNQN